MTDFEGWEFELDLGAEREELLVDLNLAIRAGEMSEHDAVDVLQFYELYKRLEALGGEISAN